MATWEWWSVDGWIPYDAKANKKISKGSLKKKPSVEITLANGTVYVIDLINLRQYLKTVPSRTRKVRFNDGSLSRVAPKVSTSILCYSIHYLRVYQNCIHFTRLGGAEAMEREDL